MKKNIQLSVPRMDKLYFSPDYTPKAFEVQNFPLQEESFNVFKFEETESQQVAITEEDELQYNFKQYQDWLSKSCDKKPSTPINLKTPKHVKTPLNIIASTPPPPGFQGKKIIFPIQESGGEEDDSPVKIVKQDIQQQNETENQNDLQLQLSGQLYQQRKNSKVANSTQPSKRAIRGTFSKEQVDNSVFGGTLKFYDLKKRFGFILMDDGTEDIFLCEDDIYLSSINLKQFKDFVKKRLLIKFEFQVKQYEEKGKLKKKAIEIRLISTSKITENNQNANQCQIHQKIFLLIIALK